MDTMTLVWSIIYTVQSVLIVATMFKIFWMNNSEYRPFLMLALFCAGLIQVSKIAGITAPTYDGYFQASKIEYLGKSFSCAFSISFITKFYKIKVPKWLLVVVYTISVGFFFIILFNDYHWLYYSSISKERMPGSVDYAVEHGPLYMVYMAFLFIVLASYLVVCYYHYKSEGDDHKEVPFKIVLMVGGSLPFVGVALCATGALNGTDFTPFFTGLAILIMSYGVMKYGLFDPVELSKEAVLNNTDTGVIVFDRYKRYLYANDIAKSIFPTVNFDARVVEGYELESLFATPGRIFERREKSYEANTAEITTGNRLEGYIAYFTDVTDLFNQNKELESLRNKAENTATQKSSFLANMSHEIRTPMNAILGMSELALKENTDEKTKGNLLQIKNAANSLVTIVNDILDVSKLESGTFKISESRYNLREMLDGVEQIERKLIDEKGLRYSVDIDPEIPDILIGDDIRIKQVLINLVNNAVKYTEKGTVALRVRQHKGRRDDEISLEFSVKDTGIGIKAEDKERVFQKFEQTNAGLSLKVEGTGLGLSICKELVTLMHGSIGVESIYGKGSRFYFEIPQHLAKNATQHDKKDSYQEATSTWTAKNVRALVVDDTEVNLKVAEGFLNIYGIDVDTIDNGVSAVSMVLQNKYDFVFIDKLMPDMDGIETINQMKTNGVLATYIALSGDLTDETKAEFDRAGFSDVLPKPLTVSNLEQCLLRHLSEEKIIRS